MADRTTRAGLVKSVLGNVQAAALHVSAVETALRIMGHKEAADRLSQVVWGPLAQAEADLEGMASKAKAKAWAK